MITAGVDVGSSTVQVALLDGDGRILATIEERIRRRAPARVARHAFDNVLAQAGVRPAEVDYVASTGDGEELPFRMGHFYGMTTHARGALLLDPEARIALDVGALHGRAILLDPRGRVLDHRMTGQCASGSGQFLENIARYLGVTLDEVGPLSLRSTDPRPPSGICAVLAETDVINLVSQGVPVEDIVKGLHVSMAQRLGRLLKSVLRRMPAGARPVVMVTGGGARDEGLVAALRQRLEDSGAREVSLRTHELSPFAGALGAAVWAAVRHRRLAASGETAARA